MTSTWQKAINAALALVVGTVVWLALSLAWGIALCFAIYVILMLDNILDRLDDLKERLPFQA